MWNVRTGLNRLTRRKFDKNTLVGHHGTPNI
jgi:ribosomal protein L33